MRSAPFTQDPFFPYPKRYTLFFLASGRSRSSLGQKAFFENPLEDVLMGFYAEVERWQFRAKKTEDAFPLIPTAEMNRYVPDSDWQEYQRKRNPIVENEAVNALRRGCAALEEEQNYFTVRVLDLPEVFADWGFPDWRVP
jgi:hypothetical protein